MFNSLINAIGMAGCMLLNLLIMSYLGFNEAPITYIAFVWCTVVFIWHIYILENSAIKSRKSS